jgi:hypothetical protein
MPGLVPGILVLSLGKNQAWMAGSSQVKPGHDA